MGKKSKAEEATQLESISTTNSTKVVSPRAKRKKVQPKRKASQSSKPTVFPPKTKQPSDDEIRLRAYFIAERRIQLRLAGDSTHDWIEARRQLIEEAKG